MTLLETVIDVTGDESWPDWVYMLIGFVAGFAGPWLAKRGWRVAVKKPAPKAATVTTTGNGTHVETKAATKTIGILMLLGCLTLSGCGMFKDVNKQYVADDRKVYDLLAARMAAYIYADAALSDHDKAGFNAVLGMWRTRIELAEKGGE